MKTFTEFQMTERVENVLAGFDAVQRWIDKGIAKVDGDHLTIYSSNIFEDAQDDAGLIAYVVRELLQRCDLLTWNLSDYHREVDYKTRLKFRIVELDEQQRSGALMSGADLQDAIACSTELLNKFELMVQLLEALERRLRIDEVLSAA